MSVSTFIELPEVKEQLKSIISPIPSKIAVPIIAPPITQNYALVGTAYDYALRFEIQRRYPHAITKPWVAQNAVKVIPEIAKLMRQRGHPKAPRPRTDETIQRKAENVLNTAMEDVSVYVKSNNVDENQWRNIIAHTIRLAKLDSIFRAGYIDETCNDIDKIEDGDINDIYRLLNITPFEKLAHPTILKLNPTFGEYSKLMGGADADLIVGDILIDVKTTKKDKIENDALYQLISYMILARSIRKLDNDFPEIRTLAIYFSRYGHLWKFPVSSIINQPNYNTVESWYLQHAREVFNYYIE